MKNNSLMTALCVGLGFVISACPQTLASTNVPCDEGETNCWSCGTTCTARLDSAGTFTVSGTGAMSGYSYYDGSNFVSGAPWVDSMADIKSVVIENGITNIGPSSFINATQLTNVSIPNSVTEVGHSSFIGATALNSVTLPDSVKTIGSQAFKNATSLTEINIPDGVTSIQAQTFWHTDLKSIDIPDSVKQSVTMPLIKMSILQKLILVKIHN